MLAALSPRLLTLSLWRYFAYLTAALQQTRVVVPDVYTLWLFSAILNTCTVTSCIYVVFITTVVLVAVFFVTVVAKFQLTKNFYAFTLILWSDTINHIIEKLFVYVLQQIFSILLGAA